LKFFLPKALNRQFFQTLILIPILFCISCSLGNPLIIKESTPQGKTPELSLAQLLKIIRERERELKGFKALVELNFSLWKDQEKHIESLKGALFFESGGAWRFKGFDLLGRTVVDLLVTKEGFQIFLPSQDQYRSGTLDQIETLWPASSLGFPHHLFTMVNSIGPLTLEPVETPMLEKGPNFSILHLLRLEKNHGVLNRKVFFQGETLDMTQQELFNQEGRLEITMDYLNYKKINGHRLPFQVIAKNQGHQASLTFKEIQPNPKFIPKDFQLSQLEGRGFP
jgi:hypothetical protein